MGISSGSNWGENIFVIALLDYGSGNSRRVHKSLLKAGVRCCRDARWRSSAIATNLGHCLTARKLASPPICGMIIL